MWLTMEKRAASGLNMRHAAGLPIPDSEGRDSLVLVAAHTKLPEAAVSKMPEAARQELSLGLGGDLRRRIAAIPDEDEAALTRLRDELMSLVASRCGAPDAVGICDAVHAGRLLRRESPVIVGAALLRWYRHYRSPDAQASRGRMIAKVDELYENWLARVSHRPDIEKELYAAVLEGFGSAVPEAIIDADLP